MFRSRPPQNSRRGRFWEWWNPKLGHTVVGWLAGPIVGIDTHYLGRTQPCRFHVSGGRMECYCQRMNLEAVWRGYVPMWNEDGVKGFTVIGERAFDLASKIELFKPIAVTRERWAGQPVMVRESEWTKGPPTLEAGKPKPLDIRPALLQLWGDKDLIDWLNNHPDARDDAASPVPGKCDAVPPAIRERAVMKPAKGQPGTLEEVLKSLPSTNGKKSHH